MQHEQDFTWFDLAKNCGVLEVDERVTAGLGLDLHLELHLVHQLDGRLLAWWGDQCGRFLWVAQVGRA